VVHIKSNVTNKEKEFFRLLQKSIHPNHWDMWFGSLNISDIKDDEHLITFAVENLFLKERLKNKYGKTIDHAVREFFGKEYSYRLDFSSLDTNQNIAESQQAKSNNKPLIQRKPVALSNLNKNYTFSRFIPGGGNLFAYNSAIEVSHNPGRFNPMFIHGEVGLGKTHLLQAVAHEIMQQHPQLRVLYITSEEFMNQLIYCIKTNTTEKFRERFRQNIDVLLIDDIQFLIGKNGIQNELFHTFNSLYDSGKQIAFCSDRNPKDLGTFHQRLISRFQMGLVIEMLSPDVNTRKRIITNFLEAENISMPEDAIEYLAEISSSNIREIIGFLIKIIMANRLQGKPVDLLTIKLILNEIIPSAQTTRKTQSPKDHLFESVEKLFGITQKELISPTRKKPVSEIRMLAMYLAVKTMKEPVTGVAEWFEKTHSSVNYSINKINELMKKENKRTIEKYERLKKQFETSQPTNIAVNA